MVARLIPLFPSSTNVYEERGKRQRLLLGPMLCSHTSQLWASIPIIIREYSSQDTQQVARYFRVYKFSCLQLPALIRSWRPFHRKYVIDHLLPQIAFDLWPLVLATGAICIVERNQLLASNNFGWFTIWHILFEVTSGYATVGVSFGTPYSTASFSASFRKLSKLIVSMQNTHVPYQNLIPPVELQIILLMLRGRHRGLPSAIDR